MDLGVDSHKVLRTVVGLVSVDVMHVITPTKFTQLLLRDTTMCCNPLPRRWIEILAIAAVVDAGL